MNGGYSPSSTPQVATNVFRLPASAAGTNAAVVKDSGGSVFQVSGYNTNAAGRYLKVYDKATTPNVGVDLPRWAEYLPPQERFAISMSAAPLLFTSGIAIAMTTGAEDTDATGVNAGDIMSVNLSFA